MAKAKKDLVFGDDIYCAVDIFESDFEEEVNYENCLLEQGTKGKFIAFKTDPLYPTFDVIAFFGDDTIMTLYREMISTEPVEIGQGFPCPVCGELNTLANAAEGCKGCGVSYNPINGEIGDGETEEGTPF